MFDNRKYSIQNGELTVWYQNSFLTVQLTKDECRELAQELMQFADSRHIDLVINDDTSVKEKFGG